MSGSACGPGTNVNTRAGRNVCRARLRRDQSLAGFAWILSTGALRTEIQRIDYSRRSFRSRASGRGFDSHRLHHPASLDGPQAARRAMQDALRSSRLFASGAGPFAAGRPRGRVAGCTSIFCVPFPGLTNVTSASPPASGSVWPNTTRGRSPHTSKFVPWRIVAAVYFADRARAEAFEKYLKQGSGHAFANRHPW